MSSEFTVPAKTGSPVVGRFAPSPTGDLHMGSLMAAVASFLQAKQSGGRWLLRIEDVDRPREVPGAADRILFDLARFGFEWDGPVIYQSKRDERYLEILQVLVDAGLAYPCSCSRREVQLVGLMGVDGPVYPGTCRLGMKKKTGVPAWRFFVPDGEFGFLDGIQGERIQNVRQDVGDFVLRRADGCWAYQLAVVVDDADSGVNQVVRGADLLDSTPRQLCLQRALKFQEPKYFHIPVITNIKGEKLSKQTLAPALLAGGESRQLCYALYLLHQNPPQDLFNASLFEVWGWAEKSWNSSLLPQCRGAQVEISACNEYQFCNIVA